MNFLKTLMIVVLPIISGIATAKCLSDKEKSPKCRYPKGDLWCAQNDNKNPYAYSDSCLSKNTKYDRVARADISNLKVLPFLKNYFDKLQKEGLETEIIRIDNKDISGDDIEEIIALYSWYEPCETDCGNKRRDGTAFVVFGKQGKKYSRIGGDDVTHMQKYIGVNDGVLTILNKKEGNTDTYWHPTLDAFDVYSIKNNNLIKKSLNGNEIISMLTDDSLTSFVKKNLEKQFINKKYQFYGEIRDVKSLREIKMRIDYGNYAEVIFNEDLPVKKLKKETPLLIEGVLSFIGSGIMFTHTIKNAELIDYK